MRFAVRRLLCFTGHHGPWYESSVADAEGVEVRRICGSCGHTCSGDVISDEPAPRPLP